MNKTDEAFGTLRTLSAREQEIAADAILDDAAQDSGPQLSDEQAAESGGAWPIRRPRPSRPRSFAGGFWARESRHPRDGLC